MLTLEASFTTLLGYFIQDRSSPDFIKNVVRSLIFADKFWIRPSDQK